MVKQKRLYKKDIDRDRVRHKRIIFNLIFQTRKKEIERKTTRERVIERKSDRENEREKWVFVITANFSKNV